MTMTGQIVPVIQQMTFKAKLLKISHQYFRIENTHHQFFTECRWQGRQTQFGFLSFWCTGFQAAILWFTFFRDVHPAQNLDPGNDGGQCIGGHVVNRMQHPINPETDLAGVFTRFHVNITGTLFKGKLQHPVHQFDNMLVIGIRIL